MEEEEQFQKAEVGCQANGPDEEIQKESRHRHNQKKRLLKDIFLPMKE
jgi:hypothetical protein